MPCTGAAVTCRSVTTRRRGTSKADGREPIVRPLPISGGKLTYKSWQSFSQDHRDAGKESS